MTRALHSAFWRALAFGVVLEAMLVPAVLFWPDFQKTLEQSSAAIEMLTASFSFARKAVELIAKEGVVPYVAMQHFFKGCNTLGAAAAILFAVGAVAGEAQRGTLEIVLARPLTRRRILLERWTSGAVAIAVPVFATTATLPWLLAQVGETLRLAPLMLCAVHQTLLLLAFYAVTFFLSSVGRHPVRIAFAMLCFCTLQFALYFVKQATDWSLYRIADVEVFQAIVRQGALDWRLCAPLLAVVVLALVGSLVAFARRVP